MVGLSKTVKFEAIISDLDGVIVNSEHEHFLSFEKMLSERYGLHYTASENEAFLGTTDQFVFTELKKRYPIIKEPLDMLIKQRTEYYISIFKEKVKPLPGVEVLFKYIHTQDIPLAVGTSAERDIAEFVLTTLHLKQYLRTIVTADDVEHGKPAPDIYLKVAKYLHVNPEKCLVFEDSFFGVQAAKSAGMTCIAIPCGPTLKQTFSHADRVLKSLTQVTPEFLDSF